MELLELMEILLLLREKDSAVFSDVFQDADSTTKEVRYNYVQLEKQRDMFEDRRYLFRFCSETYNCCRQNLNEHRKETAELAKDNQLCPPEIEEFWELKEWVRQTCPDI